MAEPVTPCLELLRRVRAAFVLQGTTLRAWCVSNALHEGNVRQALIGSWNGPKGQAMRKRAIKAAKIDDVRSAA